MVVNCLIGSLVFTLKKILEAAHVAREEKKSSNFEQCESTALFFFFTTVLWEVIQTIKTYSTVMEAKHYAFFITKTAVSLEKAFSFDNNSLHGSWSEA